MLATALSVLAVVGLALGLLAAAAGAWFWRYEQELLALPTVPATVLSSDIQEVAAGYRSPATAGSGTTRRMELQVRYRYEIGGVAYIGTRLSNWSQHQTLDLAPAASPNARLTELARRFSVGRVVPARYRPDRPEVSWLFIDRFGTRLFAPLAAGLILVGVAALAVKHWLGPA